MLRLRVFRLTYPIETFSRNVAGPAPAYRPMRQLPSRTPLYSYWLAKGMDGATGKFFFVQEFPDEGAHGKS